MQKQLKRPKKQHHQKLKEIKFHPNIDTHDYTFKVNHALAFLRKGFKVKVSMYFRGREMAHQSLGMDLLNRIKADLEAIAVVESFPKMEGRQAVMVLAPKKKQ